MKNVIFLDIDGVLNCQLFYEKREDHGKEVDDIDPVRVGWLNELCKETDSVIVISSVWRHRGIDFLREKFKEIGATFEIIGVTQGSSHAVRGVEIKKWLDDNCLNLFGVHGHDFYRYAIIDDDSDMLLNQGPHFFQTDTYSGLTPNTCYKIRRFFTHKTFQLLPSPPNQGHT